jgi:hypothetical protein
MNNQEQTKLSSFWDLANRHPKILSISFLISLLTIFFLLVIVIINNYKITSNGIEPVNNSNSTTLVKCNDVLDVEKKIDNLITQSAYLKYGEIIQQIKKETDTLKKKSLKIEEITINSVIIQLVRVKYFDVSVLKEKCLNGEAYKTDLNIIDSKIENFKLKLNK